MFINLRQKYKETQRKGLNFGSLKITFLWYQIYEYISYEGNVTWDYLGLFFKV